MNIAAHDVGFSSLEIAAYFRPSELCRYLLSMLPSPANVEVALEVAEENREEFTSVISQLPIVEWQRQIGLQEEYMCVERVISVLLAESKYNLRPHKVERDGDGVDSEEGGGTTSSLCVLVPF